MNENQSCYNTHHWKFPDKLRRHQATRGHENDFFRGRQTKTLHLKVSWKELYHGSGHGRIKLNKGRLYCKILHSSESLRADKYF